MATLGNCALPIFLWSIAAAWVAASPLQAGQSVMQRNQYGPTAAEILAAYLEDDAPDNDDPNDIVGIRGRPDRLRDFARTSDLARGLSFPSGWIDPASIARRIHLTPIERFGKRNIDEIDRTPFDDFFKRTMDHGRRDRVGWTGYPAYRGSNALNL
ncbi:orcokinin peptides isoform X2 [Halictus rubicundus]|uniref:orcokinin peptides isoform X2 n=1 Tax=Halictus rubicundus TaxID=77578 RepID=UPI0040358A30